MPVQQPHIPENVIVSVLDSCPNVCMAVAAVVKIVHINTIATATPQQGKPFRV
jgi:hypothetical protein